MNNDIKQSEILQDNNKNGKPRPWKEKKMKNTSLRNSYIRLGHDCVHDCGHDEQGEYFINKSYRVNSCANTLGFVTDPDGRQKLYSAIFCQVRLCPMCAWRREMKIRTQLSKVIYDIEDTNPELKYIFLTLTVKRVKANKLIQTIDHMQEALNRLFKYKEINEIAVGFFRALEMNYDNDEFINQAYIDKRRDYYIKNKKKVPPAVSSLRVGQLNKNYKTYNPHFHIMIAVKPDYFIGFNHNRPIFKITQKRWSDLWKRALQIDYTPTVWINTIENYGDSGKIGGILETAKYTVKDSDYLIDNDFETTDEVVETLDRALHKRRLVGWGKLMRAVHKKLNLQENVTADVNIDEDDKPEELHPLITWYEWHVGYSDYIKIKN